MVPEPPPPHPVQVPETVRLFAAMFVEELPIAHDEFTGMSAEAEIFQRLVMTCA